jgi:hypothetical protein
VKSTPDNPFLFTFDGVIPALKNAHMSDFRTPPEINNWYLEQAPKVLKQRQAQDFLDDIDGFAYTVFEYFYKDRLPKGDLDNCYTTVQELLQKPSAKHVVKKHKGILSVIANDKDVCAAHMVCLPLIERPIVGANLWLWADDPNMDHVQQLVLWDTFRTTNLYKRLNKPTLKPVFRPSLANNS